jgi:TRAP-type mannitol/chloroaromatic compound transport system substrate-binding protein
VANSWMTARYDAANPMAMKKLLAGGTKLHAFSAPIMDASFKSAKEVYAEVSATNANFKKVHDSLMSFTSNGFQWWQVAELTYDSFMARRSQS